MRKKSTPEIQKQPICKWSDKNQIHVESPWWTADEVAALFKFDADHVRKLCRNRDIPFVNLGTKIKPLYRFYKPSVDAWALAKEFLPSGFSLGNSQMEAGHLSQPSVLQPRTQNGF